ncbi:hypothetical protein [Bradyrhizobium sp. UFLA05-112]
MARIVEFGEWSDHASAERPKRFGEVIAQKLLVLDDQNAAIIQVGSL